jgi:hypothetical protein
MSTESSSDVEKHSTGIEAAAALERAGPTRVAIVSTPRSGNTWLRHLLSVAYEIPTIAVHNPRDLDWSTLPADCILQMHWHPIPSFLTRLEEHQFRIVVLARHPLDILISILHFSLHEPTARWLEGEEGNERSIYGAMPCSSAFVQYAGGRRARALLSITPEWWNLTGALTVRYESLVRDAQGELGRLVNEIGGEVKKSLCNALAATTIPRLRVMAQNDHHFWQGKPGLWKNLLTAHEAIEIARAHAGTMQTLGYPCDPDPLLDRAQADANWINLIWADLASELQTLRETKRDRDQLKTELAKAKSEFDRIGLEANQSAQEARLHIDQARNEANQLQVQLAATQTEAEKAQRRANQLTADFTATQVELERVRKEYLRIQQVVQEVVAQKDSVETAHSVAKAGVEGQLSEARRMLSEAQNRQTSLEDQLRFARTRLDELADLNATGIAVARRLGRISKKHPLMAKTAKKILRLAS